MKINRWILGLIVIIVLIGGFLLLVSTILKTQNTKPETNKTELTVDKVNPYPTRSTSTENEIDNINAEKTKSVFANLEYKIKFDDGFQSFKMMNGDNYKNRADYDGKNYACEIWDSKSRLISEDMGYVVVYCYSGATYKPKFLVTFKNIQTSPIQTDSIELDLNKKLNEKFDIWSSEKNEYGNDVGYYTIYGIEYIKLVNSNELMINLKANAQWLMEGKTVNLYYNIDSNGIIKEEEKIDVIK